MTGRPQVGSPLVRRLLHVGEIALAVVLLLWVLGIALPLPLTDAEFWRQFLLLNAERALFVWIVVGVAVVLAGGILLAASRRIRSALLWPGVAVTIAGVVVLYVGLTTWNAPLIRGIAGTLFYSFLVVPLGLLVGFLWGWARISRFRVLSWPSAVFIEIFRGIPPLVLIIFAFLFGLLVLPQIGRGLQAGWIAAAIALALHTASYQAEIFRAGFMSVPRGQLEAAHAIGMTRWQAMLHILLPQTFRLVLPPLGNEWATVIKDTSLLAAVGVTELFAIGQEFQQARFPFIFAIWTIIAAAYFLITFAATRVLATVESRYAVPGREAGS